VEGNLSGELTTVSKNTMEVRFDEKQIDSIFADVDQCHLPGAAVGIAVHGKPIYRKGFGLANIELPVALSPTIRMRIGSITKHFACFAYMLLCEAGAARIDDTIGTYLPELHDVTHDVTIRQLMGNIGGLRDVHDICWQFSGTGRPVSSAELLSLYRQIDDRCAPPGSTWLYNNGGFLMLSAAIERITGLSLEQVLDEKIFKPVGMVDTLLRRWDTDFVPNSATLHMISSSGNHENWWRNTTSNTMTPSRCFDRSYLGTALAGEAGMVSTIDDMLRWLAHMDEPIVGTAETWATMKQQQTLANGTCTGYGLGLMCGRYRGAETLSHPGGVMGGNAQMLKVPSAGLDIVVMLNRYDVFGVLLVEKILDTCLPSLEPVKEPTRRPIATGVFHSPVTGRVIQLLASEHQQIVSIDGVDLPFAPDDRGVLWPTGALAYSKQAITLVGDPVTPHSIRFSDFGNRDELVRAAAAGAPDVAPVAGCYRSGTTGTEVRICETEAGPQLTAIGRFGSVVYPLECLAENIWRIKPNSAFPPGGILSFGRDEFHFASFRTRALRFGRVS
jgi:D-aminopeptidase